MSYANSQKGYRRKHSEIRQRRLGKSRSPLSKMVGLGSDELCVSDIADMMELEISSDDESDENERGDKQRLIPSPIDHEDIVYIDGKINSQKSNAEITDDESVWSISIQMFIPFLLAGFGMVAASLLLDVVQVYQRFTSIIF